MQEKKTNPAAKRIKTIRLLTGCTQKEFSSKYDINIHSLQSLEASKTELSIRNANKIISASRLNGLECSLEWLMHGMGQAPFINKKLSIQKKKIISWASEENIQNEIAVFKRSSDQAIVTMISNDSMAPKYFIGDYVGGILRKLEDINVITGLDCILESQDGQISINSIYSAAKGIMAGPINIEKTVDYPLFSLKKVKRLSPVIWHRRTGIQNH